MAKYEREFKGNFDEVLQIIEDTVMKGSVSASLEDRSNITIGEMRVAVRVFERYSALGENRVSLSVTLVGNGDDLAVSAITSGGSQAVFWKINTWGEGNFLATLQPTLEKLASQQ